MQHIFSAIAGLIGAAAGIFLYKSGERSGFSAGYDKAESFNQSQKEIMEAVKALAVTTAKFPEKASTCQ